MPEPIEVDMSPELHRILLDAAEPDSALAARLDAATLLSQATNWVPDDIRLVTCNEEEAVSLEQLMKVHAPRSVYRVEAARRMGCPNRIIG